MYLSQAVRCKIFILHYSRVCSWNCHCTIPSLWIEWGRSARHSFLICIANQFSTNVIWQVPAPASGNISGRFKWRCTFGVLRRTPGYTLVEEQYRKRWMVTHPASVRICLTCCHSKPPSSIPRRDTLGTDVTLRIFFSRPQQFNREDYCRLQWSMWLWSYGRYDLKFSCSTCLLSSVQICR